MVNLEKAGSLISLGHLINSAIIELGNVLHRAEGVDFTLEPDVPNSLEETAKRLEAMPKKPYPAGFETGHFEFLNELYRFLVDRGHKEYAPAYQEVNSVAQTLRSAHRGVVNKKAIEKAQEILDGFGDYLLQKSGAEICPVGACF